MEIQIDPHTLERAEERGTSEKEIVDVVNTGFSIPAKYGRVGKAKIYDFEQRRYNKYCTINTINKKELKYSILLKEMQSSL
ncbi:hypothetical protein HKBW3S03_01071 [Candidatus Hakubella thermalkaliphila]|uniref:DUF4258 domain-containing protein n=1 Tax=Candidatus Hakubella thermalkaliphila TaxID=2754717 RepID=A0A6V8NR33_9ACTN|nr:hypothetical protein [Candidatus Hakubella thermalkaliphila]GFP19566.1 hypothetical protein HKBW3S03_01071 [Candidatus Hakubella thermalkaliphila]GFP22782.1 hypothetical protein HKBW3S09_00249 [Candidatus Hakubella thermalkaliphila]GFP31072.1 hypothetical protein HKBW3S34_01991 [Candidatus Hakubella thermalkaliphila]GFP39910.1 hypothetical protein HKBW3S47_01607 [Candidatus Hakubella thermalkaliphila]GFP41185.1 hypothetical protein HKBW3C_00311 [Candidatus Hakubella thermalkaliphila]